VLPISISTLPLYLAFLHDKGYSASTIASYNSAIGYYHTLGGFSDLTVSFYITKLLQGTKRKCPSIDGRFPITLSIWHKLIDALDLSYNSEYNRSMNKSMFLLVFYAFLSIGEFTVAATNATNYCLKLSSIDETREGFVISFISFKHSTPEVVEKILVQKQNKHRFCPVTQLNNIWQ
jgi:hypothetical protein